MAHDLTNECVLRLGLPPSFKLQLERSYLPEIRTTERSMAWKLQISEIDNKKKIEEKKKIKSIRYSLGCSVRRVKSPCIPRINAKIR